MSKIFTIKTGLTAQEADTRRRIEAALQGNAKPGKYAADAQHLAEAAEYCGYFITHDDRILTRSQGLGALLPPSLHVVTLASFLDIFDDYQAGRVYEPLVPLRTADACPASLPPAARAQERFPSSEFPTWRESHRAPSIRVAGYIEQLTPASESAPTAKQRPSTIRHLFDWLVVGQAVSGLSGGQPV